VFGAACNFCVCVFFCSFMCVVSSFHGLHFYLCSFARACLIVVRRASHRLSLRVAVRSFQAVTIRSPSRFRLLDSNSFTHISEDIGHLTKLNRLLVAPSSKKSFVKPTISNFSSSSVVPCSGLLGGISLRLCRRKSVSWLTWPSCNIHTHERNKQQR
jgi:hypothetical protein